MRLPSSKKNKVPDEIVAKAYSSLFAAFNSMSPISKEVEDFIYEKSHLVHYKPRDIIVRYGEVCNYVLFPLNGLVKSTFIMEDQEKVVWFMSGGEPIIAVHSWFEQTPSEEQIRVVRDTLAIAMHKSDIEYLKKEHMDFLALHCVVLERHLVLSIQRTKWQQLTVDGKISNLEKLYPNLMKEAPSKDLASYLGISRETFIRKRPRRDRD